MGIVSTSIVVQFDAAEAEGILSAEIDGREDGLNGGNTSFVPGDQPGIIIRRSSNVVIDAIYTTAGTLASVGTDTETVEEALVFADSRSETFQYPVAGNFSSSWLGTVTPLGGLPTITVTQNETQMNLNQNVIGVRLCSYSTTLDLRRLTGVPATLGGSSSFEVLIVVVGRTI